MLDGLTRPPGKLNEAAAWPWLKDPVADSNREDAAIPIAWEDRKAAGFSEEELQELAEVAGRGPSRQTLVRAAEILRKRHHARRAEGS